MLNLAKFINIPIFLISFAIGIFVVYITLDDSRKIYIYPTPENIDLIQYRDKTDTCFAFKQTEVSCPKNDAEISKIPSQV
jgi:hypothetical protein